ncbi:M60 family metallopeptidase [Bremerella sp. JC817]|uniref:M60 family metallopeptidase n=1 Tax=Bremerella sp. JC817 TaxID=3231756 RepID=UPI003459271C
MELRQLLGRALIACLWLGMGAASVDAATDAELQKAIQGEKLTEEEYSSLRKAVEKEARSGFTSDGLMKELMGKLKEVPAVEIGPEKENQFRVREHTLIALRMIVEAELAGKVLPPDQLQKHPSSDKFPGMIPKHAKPEMQVVEIDGNSYRWQSTGLYAPPGEVIHVTIPEEYVDAGWKLRIGANSTYIDTPRHSKLNRFPRIDRVFDMKKRTTAAACSFGGLVYIELPTPKAKTFLSKDSDIYDLVDHYDPPPKKPVSVRFTNVLKAPRYVHGETDIHQWRTEIRSYPAPYAEIGSDKVIFMMPSHLIRRFDTPDLAMEKWNQLIDAMSELSGRPKTKPFPHRFLIDAHVNWGAAFASYPINAPISWSNEIIRGEPGWGHAHELGHLHQHRVFTYQGTGEVTVNVFASYALEQVLGHPHERSTRESVVANAAKYLERPLEERNWMTVNGALFERLAFYLILSHELGWEPYKQVFREYRELPLDQHPKSDVDRASDFLVRMSRATNRNLGPYFVEWGVQVNQTALDEVKSLPAWESEMMKEARGK